MAARSGAVGGGARKVGEGDAASGGKDERESSEPFRVVRSIWRYDLIPDKQGIFHSLESVSSRPFDKPNTGTSSQD